MRALILNCTLEASPERSSTEALLAKRVLERMGNEDGAHQVIAEVVQSLVDIGYLVAVARALAAKPIPAPPG